ncbi:calcium-activated chloride channel regulator 1-like [Dermacentor silvarum]|uniref:calcium-activated chloride channel regulator 1-like n=1 Tax=Dermacentor silvarum TaxID=543639 RepID=UPI0021019069|nr:calcium-activated chloride channel regulator 1-like [Dermacentor silvarum]
MSRMTRIAATLLCFLTTAASLDIDTSDGGYKDIWVSISESIPYNESIIENIKDLFRSSSEFLHKATNGRVYFKHVTIEVPKTWPLRHGARALSSSFFDKSDVRVDQPNAMYGDKPFTMQKRRCGEPGDFIQVTPAFLATIGNSTANKLANPAYVMVHEWAHYRYGVFDEYGSVDDSRYPLTYCDGGKVKLNACSNRIAFTARRADGGKCSIDDRCRFVEGCMVTFQQPSWNPVESSIMFMPYLANVSQFCDNRDGPNIHNPFAPSKQNDLCKQQSTWEVISGNADFQKLSSPDPSKSIHVTFEEAQQKEDLAPRVVLVLDVSGSMVDFGRLGFLKEAARRYISDIKDGSRRLAIIEFSYGAKVVHTLMPVNVNTRTGFLNAIHRLMADGSTCIGCGLESAIELLTTANETPEGATILLMSDGEENQDPRIVDVMPRVSASKVVVNTLALGATAEHKLEELATSTRGKAFAFRDLQGNLVDELEAAFVSSTTSQHDPCAPNSHVLIGVHTSPLFSSYSCISKLVESEEEFTSLLEKKFQVDSNVGNGTRVHVTRNRPETGKLEARLTDPSGQPCKECRETVNGNDVVISIPSPAKVGTWTLHVESSSSDPVEVSVSVKSQASKGDDEPIRVTCEMSSMLVDGPDQAVIFAKVTKGIKVLLDADVFATVYRPKMSNEPHLVTVPLHDDGRDPDIQADDGTYSGYFVQFTGKGRYAVTAHVSSQKRTRLADPRGASGSFFSTALFSAATGESPFIWLEGWPLQRSCFLLAWRTSELIYIFIYFFSLSHFTTARRTPETVTGMSGIEPASEYPVDDFDFVNSTAQGTSRAGEEVAEPFQRVASGGSFQVTVNIVEKQVPPGDIRDLSVTGVHAGENDSLLVELTWTWPGAHLTYGNASGVEIRASREYAKLVSAFEKQTEIPAADIVQGNLDPLRPGAKHVVTVYLSRILSSRRQDGALDWSGYLAAQVLNADGLRSKTSNVVRVSYTPPPVTTTVATTTTQATTTEAVSTQDITTDEATTTEVPTVVSTTQATTTEAISTQDSTTDEATTTEVPTVVSSSTHLTSSQSSSFVVSIWVWILIACVAAAIVVAALLAILVKMNPSKRGIYRVFFSQPRQRQHGYA